MTQRKKESALGRGLDALIRMDATDEEEKPAPKTKKNKKETANNKPKNQKKKGQQKTTNTNSDKQGNNNQDIQEELVDSVLLEVHKNPRISLWSARSAAVLRLLKKTKPEFSISKEASALIEDAVKDKYPDLWEVFEDKDMR